MKRLLWNPDRDTSPQRDLYSCLSARFSLKLYNLLRLQTLRELWLSFGIICKIFHFAPLHYCQSAYNWYYNKKISLGRTEHHLLRQKNFLAIRLWRWWYKIPALTGFRTGAPRSLDAGGGEDDDYIQAFLDGALTEVSVRWR